MIVPAEITLEHLHLALQGAFAWHDRHLWQFRINEQKFEVPDSPQSGLAPNCKDARTHSLGKLVKTGNEFQYIYDFGDNWQHRVVVEKKRKRKEQNFTFIPICFAGENAAPPEDCGGVDGYQQYLEALRNPEHPDHKDTRNWCPGYIQCMFSTSQANALIAALYALHNERYGLDFERFAPISIACPNFDF